MSAGWYIFLLGIWGIACALFGEYEGRKRGYQKGWKEAEEWIVTAETEIDQARQEIWRKEG